MFGLRDVGRGTRARKPSFIAKTEFGGETWERVVGWVSLVAGGW